MSVPRFLHKCKKYLLFFPCEFEKFFLYGWLSAELGRKKMGLKQTLDISLVSYDRSKKLIKKSVVQIRLLILFLESDKELIKNPIQYVILR